MHVLINIHILIDSIPNPWNNGIDCHSKSDFFSGNFSELYNSNFSELFNFSACRKSSNENLNDNIGAFNDG